MRASCAARDAAKGPPPAAQHAEYHVAVELVLVLGGRAGVCTNERGTSDAGHI